MNKHTIIFVIVVLILLISGIFYFNRNTTITEPKLPTAYEYFWGDGCPHCAIVATFFESWDKKDKVNIDKKEVWSNPANAQLLQTRAKYCNIKPTEMGVPFLFTPDGKCLTGDQPIIEYFKSLSL